MNQGKAHTFQLFCKGLVNRCILAFAHHDSLQSALCLSNLGLTLRNDGSESILLSFSLGDGLLLLNNRSLGLLIENP
jgi:hypothetical protein